MIGRGRGERQEWEPDGYVKSHEWLILKNEKIECNSREEEVLARLGNDPPLR